jgi:hypothetical protein
LAEFIFASITKPARFWGGAWPNTSCATPCDRLTGAIPQNAKIARIVSCCAKRLARGAKREAASFWYSERMNHPAHISCPRRLLAVTLVLSFSAPALAVDPVIEWNEILLSHVQTPTDPARIGRTAAIMHLAVFDAVNSIVGDYRPYLESIPAPAGASAEAAAIAAAHRAVSTLHPDLAPQFDAARAASLAAIADGAAKTNGIAVGEAAADAILALRADDGFDTDDMPYTPGTRPGDYQPTPPELFPSYRPGLGQVATFGIKHGRQFRAAPPPPLGSRAYARDYQEVKDVGEAGSTQRPPDRSAVAHFYALTDGELIYFPAARQVSAAQNKTLSENARIFALVAMAIWDGAVACFETKYHYNLWRPITAIRVADTDGNRHTEPDPDWTPLVFTPPFPAYPSGHATFGAAARAVLEHVYGADGHAVTLSNPALPEIVLHYSTFKDITDDIDDGRVFGGVHFRFDQEAGAKQGRRVGEYILKHELRPVGDNCGRRGHRQAVAMH